MSTFVNHILQDDEAKLRSMEEFDGINLRVSHPEGPGGRRPAYIEFFPTKNILIPSNSSFGSLSLFM